MAKREGLFLCYGHRHEIEVLPWSRPLVTPMPFERLADPC